MDQGKSVQRVSGGVPWWLWITAIVITAAVVIGILTSRQEESLDVVFDRAIAAADQREVDIFQESFDEFQRRSGDKDRIAVLEGIHAGATNHDPKSIKLLEPYLEHSDSQIQTLATKYSANAHQRIGNVDSARALHLKCIEMAPDDVQPRLLLVGLYSVAGAVQSAAQQAEEILKLDPKDQTAMDAITSAQVATGQLDAAIENYQRYLETERERAVASPDLVAGYLNCLLKAGQAVTAQQFLADNETLVSDQLLRARIYLHSNQLDDFEELLNLANLPPNSPIMIRLKAVRAMESRDWRQAISLLGQALLSMPRSTDLFEEIKRAAVEDNDSGLVEACQANLHGLHQLEREMVEAVKAIGKDMQDPQLRLDIAEIALELSLYEEFTKWTQAAIAVASRDQLELIAQRPKYRMPTKPLVPIPSAYGATPTDGGDESDDDNSTDTNPDEAKQEPVEEESPEPEETTDSSKENVDDATESEDTTPSVESIDSDSEPPVE